MSRESAIKAATGNPNATIAPAIPNSTAGLAVTARQASRIPVLKEPVQEAAPAEVVVPIEPKIETPVTPESLSSDKFAQFAKKEAKLQREREALATEKKAMLESKAKYDDVEKKFRDFENLRQTDPIAAMKLAGFSDTDIFNVYAKAEQDKKASESPEAKAIAAADARIKEFEEKQAKQAEEAKKATDDATLKRFRSDITKTVTSDKDKYEYCNFNGPYAEDLIYVTMENIVKELKPDESMPSLSEVADMVETYFEEQDKSMNSLKKRGYKPVEVQAEVEAAPTPITRSKTLSNKIAPTVASTAGAVSKRESPAEKKARLVKQIQEHGLRK